MRITLLINNQDYNTSAPPESSIKLCVTYMPLGDKGVPGKSAYQYAVEKGYTGTEEEFAQLMVSPEFIITDEEAQTDWDSINI